MSFERYKIENPSLLEKPADIPKEYIAYNPSAIWTTEDKAGRQHDIMYVRVEPDKANKKESHLGKTVARPYEVDVNDFSKPLKPYSEADEIMGEDPALTRINRRLANGAIENVWLLSTVDAQPKKYKPNELRSLYTRFYAGTSLHQLEPVAEGPLWMKDIRIVPDSPESTKLHVYGRPRLGETNGNITHTVIGSIDDLNARSIIGAEYIDENIFPSIKGIWGGVNDAVRVGPDRYILACHRAWRTSEHGVHYESTLFGHDLRKKGIIDLGVLATSDDFPEGHVKGNQDVDLHDVVFTGGGYNGGLDYMTFGVRDGSLGIARLKKH